MAANLRVYLDTNIFIYAFDRPESVSLDISNALLEMIALNDGTKTPFLFTSELTFAELWVGAYKSQNEELVRIFDNLSVSNGFLEVGPVTLDVLRFAAVTRAETPSIKLPDAVHLSTAIGFECTHILTADRGLSGPIAITHRRNGYSRTSTPLDVIRPNVDEIERIMKAVG